MLPSLLMSSLPTRIPTVTDESGVTEQDGHKPAGFVPVRLHTYFIGIFGVVLVCAIVAFSEVVASRGGSIDAILLGATHMPPAAVGVLIVLLFVNALVGKLSRAARLNPAELTLIYFMMGCAALLSSFGLATQLLPNLIGVNYFANPQDHIWRDNFYSHIAKWLVPWDPDGPERQMVSLRFYEGLRVGESLPWRLWIRPLFAWTVFAFLLFYLMSCVATLLRRQWVDNEKLSFPLVQLPMEMIREETSGQFFRNKAMWFGFAVPVIIHGLNGLHRSFPNVPEVPVYFLLNTVWKTRPWSDMIYTPLNLAFSIIGFAYLLPLDVSFSMWFFLLFFRFQDYVAINLGHQLDPAPLYGASRYYQAYQSTGAFVVIAVSMFWLARPHLRLVRERVFGGGAKDIDANEFMSYRTAFWGGLMALLLVCFWLKAAGMNPGVALFMVLTFVFVVMLVLTRSVGEVGLLMLQPAFRPLDLWAVVAPKASLGAENLTVLSFVNGIFIRDPRGPMPLFMDSMKSADLVKVRKKLLAVGTLIAVFVGALIALAIQLHIIYTQGGIRLNTWFFIANPTLYFNESYGILSGKVPQFDYRAPIWFGVGAIFTFFLYAMRAKFWWWPFHPLGYAIGCAWPAVVYWSSFFVGWLVKSIILRYGGATTYKNFRPFFLGLILGEFASGIFWALLSGAFHLACPSIPIS